MSGAAGYRAADQEQHAGECLTDWSVIDVGCFTPLQDILAQGDARCGRSRLIVDTEQAFRLGSYARHLGSTMREAGSPLCAYVDVRGEA
jgi:hypothetical protein